MQKIYAWIKSNKMLITVVTTLIATLANISITLRSDPDVTKPTIVIIVPEDVQPAQGIRDRESKIQMLRIRAEAAVKLSKEKNVSLSKALSAVLKVSDEEIYACAIKAGFPVQDLGDGEFLKKLFAWFLDPANQEKIMKFIAFIMQLAAVFM